MRQRIRAIGYCLKYGLLPWWAYEATPHYDCSWWQHLLINLRYAWVWLSGQETDDDRAFEAETNANP